MIRNLVGCKHFVVLCFLLERRYASVGITNYRYMSVCLLCDRLLSHPDISSKLRCLAI